MYRSFSLAPLLIALAAVACTQSEDGACGKGTVYRDGDCHPAGGTSGSSSISAAGAANAAGGAADAGAAGSATIDEPDPSFGLACSADQDCSDATNYCVPQSPFDVAYCSARDCDQDPTLCPTGWACTDLSRFQDGLPWACTRPLD